LPLEILQCILDAEKQAEEMINDAQKQAAQAIKESRVKAEDLWKEAEQAADKKARALLAAAEVEAERKCRIIRDEQRQIREAQMARARKKIPTSIELVLERTVDTHGHY
jgi:V/A-type H+-transporting ATPase subunit G/H